MKQVKVIKPFPGVKVGDVLTFDDTYKRYVNNVNDFAVETVDMFIGEFFEIVKEPKLRNIEEVIELRDLHKIAYDDAKKQFNDSEKDDTELHEQMTTHWNILKVLDYVLGN